MRYPQIEKVLDLASQGWDAHRIKSEVDLTLSEVQTVIKAERFARTQPNPTCCSRLQFIAWLDAIPDFKHAGIRFCHDCTPEFKRKSLKAGKCNHREVVFGWRRISDGEGYELVGVPPNTLMVNSIKPLTAQEYWAKEIPMFKGEV